MNSVTTQCSDLYATVSGRSVSVVDTPGFFDKQMKHEEFMTGRNVYLPSPGPHTFLVVFRLDDRFTKEEQQIPQKTEDGQGELKCSIFFFTHGQLVGGSIEKLIDSYPALRRLVDECGGRFHVFNNKDEKNREQVNDLLQEINTMIEQNGGRHYSNQRFEDAQRFRQEEERSQREEEKRKQQEEEQRQEETNRDKRQKRTEQRIRAELNTQRFEQDRLKAERQSEREQQVKTLRLENSGKIRAEKETSRTVASTAVLGTVFGAIAEAVEAAFGALD
ncbi:GTPase IMAP family member 9 [Labeo rohita]|uniref:GTPase IMAP family member 9 n=1 Tax=Labeo rohita TaxID=84645 RepID=A0ABQ8L536_LABRO|nr:GTPase IMAP family member 9 [Labeo rohita]